MTMNSGQEKRGTRLAGQNRLRLVMAGFALCFLAIGLRAGIVALWPGDQGIRKHASNTLPRLPRPDITDRNGVVLASDIRVASLFANPRKILDVDEAIEKLTAILPDLDAAVLRRKLTRKNAFIWLKRELSPVQRTLIHNQGIPGIGFRNETRRVYPMGRLASHVLGYVDVDSRGLSGMEKFLDDQGALYTASLADPLKQAALPATLSIDTRVQYAMADELAKAIARFKAKAGAGVVLDVHSGEVISLVSLPDFNPNNPVEAQEKSRMNRVTTGVFELGSVIKAVTFAMAFDADIMNMDSRFDARKPLVIGRAKIHDFHAQRRVLSVPEVFVHSSNIGTARMALAVGQEGHKAFLKKAGLFSRLRTELPEAASPIIPKRWSRLTTVTASFGHGFAVQPLQGATVAAALVNGGILVPPTFLKRDRAAIEGLGQRLISAETSRKMRELFRLNAVEGTARKANVPGIRLGGKTGTAEKVVNGRYSKNHRLNTFIGAFPMDDPAYVIFILLDEPQPVEGTHGYATSGWNAVPTTGKVVARIAPLLSIVPKLSEKERAAIIKKQKAKGN